MGFLFGSLPGPVQAETQLPWCGPREGSAALAQLVERLTRNEKVAGSIPAGGPSVSCWYGCWQIGELWRRGRGNDPQCLTSQEIPNSFLL